MNEKNYGTREACEKLVKAGIVLETEFYWCDNLGWVTLRPKEDVPIESCDWKIYPAPSMAEVNQDLPESDREVHLLICRYLDCGLSDSRIIGLLRDINKMINFLIWVTEQRKESHD